jgi:Bacterial Ig-like domain (group 3)/FG-GAP-like repeat
MGNVSSSACRRIVPFRRVVSRLLLAAACSVATAAQAATLSTTTTLTLSSSTVASLTEVTLTASVTAGGAAVTTGSITFCDLSAYTHCEDAAVVGRAQLNGMPPTATLKYFPGPGFHKYTAMFNGTTAAAASASPPQTFSLDPTTTMIAATGGPSGYDLTATVVGIGNHPSVLDGSVTFQDTTDNNLLGIVPLTSPPVYTQTITVAQAPLVTTGVSPSIIGVGDFNGDGIPDLAIENAGDNSISIMLGNGDGTFTQAPTSPIIGAGGTSPCEIVTIQSNCAIVVGDFNDDGVADLALTNRIDNTVIILKGNGGGSFTPFGPPIGGFNNPEALKIGDFNNDGVQDLAVANADDNTISILLGNGDGTFKPAIDSQVGSFPFFLAVADFNGDGIADLAVVNGNDDTVTLLKGNGDGTFTPFPASPLQVGDGASPIVAADFNGDGQVDLAVANFTDNNVDIFLGNGAGTFTSQPAIPVGLNPFSMTALDYNGDGITDLAVGNYHRYTSTDPGTMTLLIGNGDGSFSQAALSPIIVGQYPNDVVAADFNRDGKPDLAIPNSGPISTSGGYNTTILLNTSTATETATATLPNVVLIGAGTHVVEASYPGNTEFAPSSATIDLQGLVISDTLTLTANPIEQMITMPVTLTAQLGLTSSLVAPTGTVTFYDQSVNVKLGTAPVGLNGQAVLTISSMGPGIHSITASYGGDTIFPPSTSNAVSVKIDELRLLRVGNNNTTILPGTTVVYTIEVQPQVATTFLYNVSFAASGLPAGATATFSPTTLAAGGSMTNITMTVKTAGTAMNKPPPSPFERLPLALGILLPLLGTRAVRRRLRQIPPYLGVALFAVLSLAAVAGLSGCSGAGLFAARKVPYTITVTGTEGTVARTVEVPLAIQ